MDVEEALDHWPFCDGHPERRERLRPVLEALDTERELTKEELLTLIEAEAFASGLSMDEFAARAEWLPGQGQVTPRNILEIDARALWGMLPYCEQEKSRKTRKEG